MAASDPFGVQSLPLVSLRAVQLQPGDVVVLTTPADLKPHEREYWGGVLDDLFPSHGSLLLDGGADLSVLRSAPESPVKTKPFPLRKRA